MTLTDPPHQGLPPLSLTPGAGPRHAPAGQPHRGLFTGSPVRYTVPGPGMHRMLLAELNHTVQAGDELVWAIFPEADPEARNDPAVAFERLFLATGVSLDLILEDGGRLAALPVRDQHRVGLGPRQQAESKTLQVDQWNLKRVALDPILGRRVTAVEVVSDTPGGTGWIEFLGVGNPGVGPLGAITAGDGTLAGRAITTRGSHSTGDLSRGLTVPVVAVPNGFAMVTPVTDPGSWGQAYHWHSGTDPDGCPALAAFAVTHIPSPWIGDHGVVQFFPTAPGPGVVTDRAGRQQRRLRFRHGDEFARPHHYRVRFEDGTQAAVAPTRYGVIAEFSHPDGVPALVFDQIDDNGGLDLSDVGRGIVRGTAWGAGDMAAGSLPLHFHAEFDRQIRHAESLDSDGRGAVHGIVEFGPGSADRVTMRLATSFISAAQAQANLSELLAGSTVTEVAAVAATLWDELLGLVSIDGAGEDTTTTLVSNLYRMFLYPNTADEPGEGGEPIYAHHDAKGGIEALPGRRSVSNGFWDTYRTIWPMLQLLCPDRAATLLDGFVEHFRADGWMPRWSAPGPADLMVGTSSDNILGDAAVNSVELLDQDAAYASALKNATVPSPSSAVGRKGLSRGIFTGFVDTGVHEGMSWSLENAISDASLAEFAQVMAAQLGDTDPQQADRLAERDYFRARAANHALLFDPVSGFYRGRDASGAFATNFDPAAWGGDYTETNAWGMRFTAPHDGHGLAFLHGGADRLGERLDEFFSLPERATADSAGWYGRVIHEMTEARNVRLGMFGPSNQPAHHVPFMYSFSDRPWRLDPIVRDCVRRLFLGNEIGQGYPGDEDTGEMSAWWLCLALGLYPLWGGSGEFVLCSPSFDRISVQLPGGRRLVVETRHNDPRHDHIQSVTINGTPWWSRSVPYALIATGAEIVVNLGADPSWAKTATAPRSLTAPGEAPHRLVDAAVTAHLARAAGHRVPIPAVVDDRGDTEVRLLPGEAIELDLSGPRIPRLVTVTCGGEPLEAPSAWSVEAVQEGPRLELGRFSGQKFRWPRQTRPFRVEDLGPATGIRLRNLAPTPVVLRQVEVLVDVSR